MIKVFKSCFGKDSILYYKNLMPYRKKGKKVPYKSVKSVNNFDVLLK